MIKYSDQSNFRKKIVSVGSQFPVTVYHYREVKIAELEATGHIILMVKSREQRINAYELLLGTLASYTDYINSVISS